MQQPLGESRDSGLPLQRRMRCAVASLLAALFLRLAMSAAATDAPDDELALDDSTTAACR